MKNNTELRGMMPGLREVNVSRLIDSTAISRFQVVSIVLCGLVAVLDGFDTQSIAFVAPVIAGAWGLEISGFGPIFGAGLLGLMVGALLLGPVADRIGRKGVIILSVAWFGVCSLLTVTTNSFSGLLLLRFLTGIGLGGAMPNVIALTSEYSPSRARTTLVSLMSCGFGLGAVLGGLVSTRLIPMFGWPSVFYLGGALPLLLIPVLIVALPESIRFLVGRGDSASRVARIAQRIDLGGHHDANSHFTLSEKSLPGIPVRHLFTDGRAAATILLWVVFFCNLLTLYFLINWLPWVLQRAGLPIERAIIGTVLLNLGGIIGGLVVGRLIDRRRSYMVLVAVYLGAAVFVYGIGLLEASIAVLMSFVLIAGFCVIGAQMGSNAFAAQIYPTAARSTGVGWALGIGRVGSIVGPVVGGMMISLSWDLPTIFAVSALPALIAAVSVFGVCRFQPVSASQTVGDILEPVPGAVQIGER